MQKNGKTVPAELALIFGRTYYQIIFIKREVLNLKKEKNRKN